MAEDIRPYMVGYDQDENHLSLKGDRNWLTLAVLALNPLVIAICLSAIDGYVLLWVIAHGLAVFWTWIACQSRQTRSLFSLVVTCIRIPYFVLLLGGVVVTLLIYGASGEWAILALGLTVFVALVSAIPVLIYGIANAFLIKWLMFKEPSF